MPLLRKTAFPLLEPPEDLEPKDLVFQVRFTKEIFHDYREYVNRMDFYRQRIWTCKISGKANLTYEEALVSEKLAGEKVQEIPKELVEPALRVVQFSMLSLKNLAKTISEKLKEYKFVGDELHARKGESLLPCKILKILEDCNGKTCYEIKWLENSNKLTGTSVVKGNDLIRKKKPWSIDILKSLIRESTYRRDPWVLHDQLAEKYGISNNPPDELRGKVFILDGVIHETKRKSIEDGEEMVTSKKRKGGGEIKVTDVAKNSKTEAKQVDAIKYPIDDLLVQPAANDPVFTERPLPSRDFNVPADCVGDLLLVWDYCYTFGRLLKLWPFPLEEFEKAICSKDSDLTLIVEIHSALLCLLHKGNGDRYFSAPRRDKTSKVTSENWTEYLCDFIEKMDHPGLSASTETIKGDLYGVLDIQVKLAILHKLVNEAVGSALFRKKMDECVEQRQLLGSAYRAEALEEARKKREEKERSKTVDVVNGIGNGHCVVDSEGLQRNQVATVNLNSDQNGGDFLRRHNSGGFSTEENHTSDRSDNDDSTKIHKGQNMDVETGTDRRTAYKRKLQYNREMEKLLVCTVPLGKDRHYQRYWWFQRGDARIFVESFDCKEWGFYSSKEELDALMGSLNRKGEREMALHMQLEKWHDRICAQMEKRSKHIARETLLNNTVLRRSTRVQCTRVPPATSYLRYVNKWKEE
ncbi:DDT domain-containing protein DDB_G0282237 [Linum grandiflorum]